MPDARRRQLVRELIPAFTSGNAASFRRASDRGKGEKTEQTEHDHMIGRSSQPV